jgi:phosphate/sulfate permease
MTIFTIILIILVVTAILDLTVGVSNDAANFLNSAFGAKVAPRLVIMIVASIGIIIGVTFSSGMMEVARKGIFFPGMFTMPELMFIFLAVMLTDVLLLDSFNSLGLPTSTTVSIVFELLGAAVAISVIKLSADSAAGQTLADYINTGTAMIIVGGIFLSVAVAFTVGAIVQFITRLVFTFNFEKNLRRYGAILAGIALTAILYFILIKGAKGASFMDKETKQYILGNAFTIMLISFAVWTSFFYLWQRFSSYSILKIVILAGTFALAMAFAANDLVNFIGVPLAGLAAFGMASETSDPLNTLMAQMAEPVQTETYLLLIAGAIMVVTLWVSKKAQTVRQTELNLGRQSEGEERFGSSMLSRSIVRTAYSVFRTIQSILPEGMRQWFAKRMELPKDIKSYKSSGNQPAFNLLRSSINLTIASALISLATSYKLPLSTTYVTFMVSMGTSLSDRAWGRESAAYRVNGVITVVGGWFLTALIAFMTSFLMATLIYYGGIASIAILVVIIGFVVYHFYLVHKEKAEQTDEVVLDEVSNGEELQNLMMKHGADTIESMAGIFQKTVESLFASDRFALRKQEKASAKLESSSNSISLAAIQNHHIYTTEEDDSHAENMTSSIVSIRNLSFHLNEIVSACQKHVENQHNELSALQKADLQEIIDSAIEFSRENIDIFRGKARVDFDERYKKAKQLKKHSRKIQKNQIKKAGDSHVRIKQIMLVINILRHMERIIVDQVNLVSTLLVEQNPLAEELN